MIYSPIKPSSWFIVFLLLLLGAIAQGLGAAPGFYYAGYISGLGCMLWIFFATWNVTKGAAHESEAEKIKQYLRLSPQQRYELGYIKAPETVKVESTIKRDGGSYSKRYEWIKVSPAVFLIFARSVLGGRPIRFSEWVGKSRGKIFSDKEYDDMLKDLMKNAKDANGNPFAYVYKNGSAENSPYELTEAGVIAFYDFVMQSGQPFKGVDEIAVKFQPILEKYQRIIEVPDSSDSGPVPADESPADEAPADEDPGDSVPVPAGEAQFFIDTFPDEIK